MTNRVAVLVTIALAVLMLQTCVQSYASANSSRRIINYEGGQWTMFTYDYNDSRYNPVSVVNSSNAADLVQRWKITTNSAVTSTPIVANGSVYFADWAGQVICASLSHGKINWEVNLGTNISSSLALAKGIIYVELGPLGPPEMYALNATNGATIWTLSINSSSPGVWTSPIIYNGMVFVGVASNLTERDLNWLGQIDAVNATTGKVIWSFNTMIGNVGGAGVWATPAIDPALNAIYFGTGNSYGDGNDSLYAYSIMSVNALNGSVNWYYQVYNNKAQGNDFDFGSSVNLFSVKINGTEYQAAGEGNKNGYYYIVNRLTGALLEKVQVGSDLNDGIIGVPGFIYVNGVATNPELFIPSDDKVNSTCCGAILMAYLPSSNTVAWTFQAKNQMLGSVAIAPGVVFFGDTSSHVYAVSTSNGTLLWSAKLAEFVEGGVSLAGGYVLVPYGGAFKPGGGIVAYSP